MNKCHDRHEITYKIKYKPLSPRQPSPEWCVCEKCFGKPEFFGAVNEIEVITSLKNCLEVKLEIEHLSIMTSTIASKIHQKLSA